MDVASYVISFVMFGLLTALYFQRLDNKRISNRLAEIMLLNGTVETAYSKLVEKDIQSKDTAIRLQERCNRLTSELSEMRSARDFSEDLIASIEAMIHNHQNQSDLPPSVNLADGVPINE